MKAGAVILGVLVSVALLAGAGVLYVLAENSDARPYRTSIDLVRQIRLLSSNWSLQIARVKSDPQENIDSLDAFVPRMASLRDSLSEATMSISDLPPRLVDGVNVYLGAIDAMIDNVERYKIDYAVVRNSARYVPIAKANVSLQARGAGDERLVQAIENLTYDLNSYLATPADAVRAHLTDEMQRLRGESPEYAPPLANALANFISHTEVLLERLGPTEKLFQAATSNEVSRLTDRLSGRLEFELRRKEVFAAYCERGMVAVILVLVLFWVGLVWQQRARRDGFTVPVQAPPEEEVSAAAPRAAPRRALTHRTASAPGSAEAVDAAETAAPVSVAPAAAAASTFEATEPAGAAETPAAGPSATPAPESEAIILPPDPERDVAGVPPAESAAEAPASAAPPPSTAAAEAVRPAHAVAPEADAVSPEGDLSPAPGGASSADPLHAESLIEQGFLTECVVESLAAAAGRIAAGMDHLAQSQNRIRIIVEGHGDEPDPYAGTGLGEEMEAAAAASSSLRGEASGLAELARRFGTFSQTPNGVVGYEMVDVNACIDEVIEATGVREAGAVAKNLADIPEIFASKAEIRLLLAKIVENSMHALRALDGRSGVVKLDTARKDSEILVTVIDNGVGIASNEHKKIFEPFHTSREEAMGMGLALASHLVKGYHGAITVNSLPGHGTVFRVTLPIGTPAA